MDRGALLTRTLFGAGLLLLGIVVAVLVLRRPESPPPAATTTTAAAPPPATTAAPPPTVAPPPGPVRVASLAPLSVTVAWRTKAPTTGRLAVALGGDPPTLWSAPVGPSVEHTATVGGLAFDADYRVAVAGHTLELHTPQVPASTVVSTGGGSILVGGQPFFPLMVWGQCPARYEALLAAGINLLAENPCGGTNDQVDALAGRALSAGLAGDAQAQNPSVVGWFYPDEADGRKITAAQLPAVPPSDVVGRISLLTLTNHFYSQAAPLAWGRGIYRGLIEKSDVVGFDLYPLQLWCHTELDHVYGAQVELVRLAAGKPTFQWIETAPMGCRRPRTAVTPASVRAETWLAVAGGAHGIGYFPGEWSAAIGDEIARLTHELKSVAPALLGPAASVAAQPPLRVAARTLNGALYLVAANPTRRALRVRIDLPGLAGRTLRPLGGGPALRSDGDAATGGFPPFGADVYVAAPR